MVKESESARVSETRNNKHYINNSNNNHLNTVNININVNNEAANLEDYFASLEDNNEDEDDGDDLNSSLMEREELQKKIRHLRYYWETGNRIYYKMGTRIWIEQSPRDHYNTVNINVTYLVGLTFFHDVPG